MGRSPGAASRCSGSYCISLSRSAFSKLSLVMVIGVSNSTCGSGFLPSRRKVTNLSSALELCRPGNCSTVAAKLPSLMRDKASGNASKPIRTIFPSGCAP